jgi:hypothetical protein
MRVEIVDQDEQLYRQVHPSLLDGEVPASSNFLPKASDNNLLSVDRSSITTPKEASDLYKVNGGQSASVFGLTVSEFREETIVCLEDAILATAIAKENLAHAVADFSQHGKSQQKKIAKRLKHKAIARGRLHP